MQSLESPCVCCGSKREYPTRTIWSVGQEIRCCQACFPPACFDSDLIKDHSAPESRVAHFDYINSFVWAIHVIASDNHYLVDVWDAIQHIDKKNDVEQFRHFLATLPMYEVVDVDLRNTGSGFSLPTDMLGIGSMHFFQAIALQRVLQFAVHQYSDPLRFDQIRPPRFALLRTTPRGNEFCPLVKKTTIYVSERKFTTMATIVLNVIMP